MIAVSVSATGVATFPSSSVRRRASGAAKRSSAQQSFVSDACGRDCRNRTTAAMTLNLNVSNLPSKFGARVGESDPELSYGAMNWLLESSHSVIRVKFVWPFAFSVALSV